VHATVAVLLDVSSSLACFRSVEIAPSVALIAIASPHPGSGAAARPSDDETVTLSGLRQLLAAAPATTWGVTKRLDCPDRGGRFEGRSSSVAQGSSCQSSALSIASAANPG
jgi:hypothetical protein